MGCSQHPNFTLSNPSLKNISLNEFLNEGANKPKFQLKGIDTVERGVY